MPLTSGYQAWSWRNPLNLLPLGIFIAVIVSIALIVFR
jgi:hypothetical protein